MGKKLRARWGILGLAGALMAMLAMIPAYGSHDLANSDILRLNLGTGGNFFRYEPLAGEVVTQPIPTTGSCSVSVDGALVTLTGNKKGPGFKDGSIGVMTGNAQGVPCSRIDSNETLTLRLNTGPAVAAELDLELKGDVQLALVLDNGETYTVRSGSKVVNGQGVDGVAGDPYRLSLDSDYKLGNCRFQSDSGPDSGPNDNCRVVIHPDTPFSSIQFKPSSGEVSLEGGSDYASSDGKYDTLFYFQGWDGELDCGDTTGPRQDGSVVGEIIRHDNADGETCTPKLFRLIADEDDEQNGSVVFEVSDPADQNMAFFEALITFEEDLDANVPMFGTLEYDPDGTDGYDDFKTMPACLVDPLPGGTPNAGAIPDGHEGCVIEVTQHFDGTTEWHAVFMGDWKFR